MNYVQNVGMRPDATQRRVQPEYIRELLDRAKLSPLKAGRAIGVSERVMYYYLNGERQYSYVVQFALECLPKKA